MADRYWPNASPIDRRVRLTRRRFDSDAWIRIVGVVEDVRHVSLSRGPVPEMYRPYAQAAVPDVQRRGPDRPASRPRSRRPRAPSVLAIDPGLPVYDVRTMEDRIAASFAQTRGTMLLLLVTAALAAALAGVAIYGSIWYSVSQRLPEIGIRLALGATRASVFADVLAQRRLADVHRRGVGNGRIDRRGPADRRPALRHAGDRSGDACGRRRARCWSSRWWPASCLPDGQ